MVFITWYNENWDYRKNITVTNNTASAMTNYQTLIIINTAELVTAGKMQADCDDLRFADLAGTLQDFWVESGKNTTTTRIWVRVKSINASSTKDIYMYYGYSSATDATNLENTLGSGIVSLLPFNGNANDIVGSNDGTVTSATLTNDERNVANQAYHFDKTDDKIIIADDASIKPTGSIAFGGWAKIEDLISGASTLFYKDGASPGQGYMMYYDSADYMHIFLYGLTTPSLMATIQLDYGVWHHYFCSYDGSNIKLYIDGVERGSVASTGTINTNTDPLQIGLYRTADWFAGDISGLRFYDEGKTLAQVNEFYISTEPTYSIGSEETDGITPSVSAEYLPVLTDQIDVAITNARTGANNKYFNIPIVNDVQIMFIHISQ